MSRWGKNVLLYFYKNSNYSVNIVKKIKVSQMTIFYFRDGHIWAWADHWNKPCFVHNNSSIFMICIRYAPQINKLSALPYDANVHCCHEYRLLNLLFAKHVEPNKQYIVEETECRVIFLWVFLLVRNLLLLEKHILHHFYCIQREKYTNVLVDLTHRAVKMRLMMRMFWARRERNSFHRF